MSRRRAAAVGALGVTGGLGIGGPIAAGSLVCAPVHHEVGAPPPGFAAVRFPSASGTPIAGWVAEDADDQPLVLLVHGYLGDRRQLLGRADFLRAAGYAVALFDLQGHGESGGDRITFGARERHDVVGAVRWARRDHPDRPVAAIGFSLGGASVLLAGPDSGLDAAVVEATFPTIAQAADSRLEHFLGTPGPLLAPLLLWQMPVRLGVSADEVRPIEAARTFGAPLLVVGGDADWKVPVAASEALFAAASAPKGWWLVPGAGHEDFHAVAPTAYEVTVLDFLRTHLPPTGRAP